MAGGKFPTWLAHHYLTHFDHFQIAALHFPQSEQPIAIAFGTTFDRRIGRNGIRSRIALISLFELDWNQKLIRSDDGVGNARGSTFPLCHAKVFV